MSEKTAILTKIISPEGVRDTDYTAYSLGDSVQYEPEGVYTVGRTYNHTYALKLDAHLTRLENSAALTGVSIVIKKDDLRRYLRQLVEEAGHPDARYRLTVSAENPRDIYVAIEPLPLVPAHIRAEGARIITFPVMRHNAAAKATEWMEKRTSLQAQLVDGLYDGMLCDNDGNILEGLGSNFYAIKGDQLWTAKDNVLLGIGRSIVIEVAPSVLPVNESPVNKAYTDILQEAFLTSSSRGVVPIVDIDGIPIGTGKPGPFTQRIAEAYNAWTQAHIEAI